MRFTGKLNFLSSKGHIQEWMVDGLIFTVSSLTDGWTIKYLKEHENRRISVMLSPENTLWSFRNG